MLYNYIKFLMCNFYVLRGAEELYIVILIEYRKNNKNNKNNMCSCI